MGTINYFTSDIVTVGMEGFNFDENNDEEDYETALDIYNQEAEEFYYQIENSIKKIGDLEFYNVSPRYGYYEGCQIVIRKNFTGRLKGQDKKDALKELTKIKKLLIASVENGLVVTYPGWVTGWENYYGSISKIKEAIKEEKIAI